MSQIVHITFEKLTGLRGDIEGDFICDPESIDAKLPLILIDIYRDSIVFRQINRYHEFKFIKSIGQFERENYITHFKHGTNFLIKQWSHGGGVTINSQPPN